MTFPTEPHRNDDRRHEDGRPHGHGPGDEPSHPHPILESFNAEEVVESPGALDEEPSTIIDADIPPPL